MATNRCNHAGCNCETQPGKQFCSDHCEQNKAAAHSGRCGCNHAACQS